MYGSGGFPNESSFFDITESLSFDCDGVTACCSHMRETPPSRVWDVLFITSINRSQSNRIA